MNRKILIFTSLAGLATLGLALLGVFQRKGLENDIIKLRESLKSLMEEKTEEDDL